jgi:hypothetical protein
VTADAGLDVAGLLTIDVAAELRKLCQAQLQGPFQLPAELVRRSIRAGAREVRVTLGRGLVVVADDGPPLDPALAEWTSVLMDRQRSDGERHRALTTLEQGGELALLALAGLPDVRALTLETTAGSERQTTQIAPGGTTVARGPAPAGASGTRITLRAPGIQRRAAARWLADVARFAPVPVLLDGVPIADVIAGSLAQAPLPGPLRGRVALVAEGDNAHAYLLAHGLVTAHVTIPDSPCFLAAVELATGAAIPAPSRLRDALQGWTPALVDCAVTLLIASGAALATGPEAVRARVARLVLQAARRRLGVSAEETGGATIERVAAFRTVGARGPALVDLATVRRLATADPAGALAALSPGQRPDRFALGGTAVLVADDAERSLIAEVLGIRLRTPSRRHSAVSLAATFRRLLNVVPRIAPGWLDRLRHPRPRAATALTPAEQALLAALRDQLRINGDASDPLLCDGDGPPRRTGGKAPVLVLPRGNPVVAASVRAFNADPGWLRVVHLALVSRARSGPPARRVRAG